MYGQKLRKTRGIPRGHGKIDCRNQMRSNSKKNIHIYPQCEERGRGTTLEKHNTLVSEQNKISMNLLN